MSARGGSGGGCAPTMPPLATRRGRIAFDAARHRRPAHASWNADSALKCGSFALDSAALSRASFSFLRASLFDPCSVCFWRTSFPPSSTSRRVKAYCGAQLSSSASTAVAALGKRFAANMLCARTSHPAAELSLSRGRSTFSFSRGGARSGPGFSTTRGGPAISFFRSGPERPPSRGGPMSPHSPSRGGPEASSSRGGPADPRP
mmetsp:Transcript_41861/g.99370  ORF Transcript_41861/g.99370 Transcript_41861/m.99370 type:complete len:204 (+) Transcript_41861:708-1319(+)